MRVRLSPVLPIMSYTDKNKQREFQRKRVAAIRAEYLNNKSCVRCGATEQLEVDHIDPSLKTSHRIWSWSKERRLAELSKCQILCKPCHSEKTWENKKAKCGTTSMYSNGCRCLDCKNAASAAKARWRKSTGKH